MANDIQELKFNVTDPTLSIGPIPVVRNWRVDVKKSGSDIGSYVLYDTTFVTGNNTPILRNDKTQVGTDANGNPQYIWKTSIVSSYQSTYNNLSEDQKKFLFETMTKNADAQRAKFINASYTQNQKNNLFPNMPGVRNTASPATAPPAAPGGTPPAAPGGTPPAAPGGTPPAAPGGTPPAAPGGTPPGPQLGTPNPSKSLEFARTSGLRYPKEISTTQDRIKFQAAQLEARDSPSGSSNLSDGFAFQFPKPKLNNVDGPVIIAIQAPISDQNSVDWGPDSINAIDSALYNASYDVIKDGDATSAVSDFFKNIISNAKGYEERIQRLFAGQAASINNILARTDNVILNPNLELLFQGPQLRPFTFQFKMSARNQPEADEIRRIINYFKYHMAVREEKGLFLKAPHVFKIQYEKGEGELHPGINLISPMARPDKACALTNCSVDYTPLGSYMTYKDGTMVSYTLSLQFQELTPILDTDYKDIYNENKDWPMQIGY